MAAATLSHRQEKFSSQQVSQSMKDVVDEKYKDLRRPRRIRFFCNGDRYFKGKVLFITPHRYLSFKDLLVDLTAKMPSGAHLPYGVRKLYHSVTGAKIRSIEELQDGGDYVCSGFDSFKSIKYGAHDMEPWSFGQKAEGRQADRYADFESDFDYRFRPGQGGAGGPNYSGRGLYGPGGFAPGRTLRQTYPRRLPNAGGKVGFPDTSPNKPKVVTVVRNGARPRKKVTILLNRRSVQSFEQLVADISEALGSPRWKNNRVRKLYTLKGREVQGVSDFFRDDDVFIALGTEQIGMDQVSDILEDLYPDNPYAKNMLKEWERSKRRRRGHRNHQLHVKDQQDPNGDSGYGGDGDSSQDGDDQRKRGKPRRWEHTGKDGKSPAYPSSQAEDAAIRMEFERQKASHKERDAAHNRENKRRNAEKRALDEEKRKQGGFVHVLRAQDEQKKISDRAKEKERERKRREEEERKRKEDEERRLAEEAAREKEKKDREEKARKEREAEERRQAEENARKRAAEQQRLEEEERQKKEKEEKDKKKEDTEPKTDEVKEEKKEKKTRAQVMKENKLRRQVSDNQPVLDKYDLGRVLGDGNFAIVKDAKLKKMHSMVYAIKIIDKSKMRGKEHMIENEIQIMKDCNHPNICRLYEEYETATEIYLVMELVKGGDLFDAITQSIKFTEFEASFMVRDLVQALFYLHSRKIVHRDMKPENLLVVRNKDSTISLKLADFGLAMEVHEPIYTVCGTPTYVAPEILQETGYGLEVDMWALGVITYILLCGFPPFRSPERNQTELFEFIKAGEFEYLKPYWDNVSDTAKDLINHLLVVDIKKRYTAIDVLCHPWIISLGGSQELPDNLTDYRRSLRLDLERQARSIYKEYHGMYKRKTTLAD